MKKIQREKRKIKKGKLELKRRRLKWTFSAKELIFDECNKMSELGNSLGYPFRLFCHQGCEDVNSETIQFGIGLNHTGIEQLIEEVTEQGVKRTRKKVLEKGCALVFSQGPTGNIAVMIYPYKSEMLERKEEFIFLYVDLHPDQITRKLVRRCVMKCLFYARCSSVYGLASKVTTFDRAKLFWLNFRDVRSRNNRIKSFVELSSEWWKLVWVAVVTWAVTWSVTVLTQAP